MTPNDQIAPEAQSWGGDFERLLLGWDNLSRWGIQKDPVLCVPRERGEIKEKNGSEKEYHTPELDRFLSLPILYFGTEGVYAYYIIILL